MDDFLIPRIFLVGLSIFAIFLTIKFRKDDRIGNQFFVVINIFWVTIFLISIKPDILDSVLNATGLVNKSQFLFGISLSIIIYLLYIQSAKSKSTVSNLNHLIRSIAFHNFRELIPNLEKIDILINIAAKNEEKTIGNVIEKIKNLNIPYKYKILVINDGSTDKTEAVAIKAGAIVINHFYNLGIGAAIKTGFIACKILKPRILINIDADEQHNPKYIPKLIEKIENENLDLVYTSRFSKQSSYKTNFIRSSGNKFYTKLVNRLGHISISDVTSGYRALRAEKINSVYFCSESNFSIELALRAAKNKLRISEIPIESEERKIGRSQFHRIEKFLIYNFIAVKQIFNSYFRSAVIPKY